MGALCQRVKSEYELCYWPFLPREMLENAKENRHQAMISEGWGQRWPLWGTQRQGKPRECSPSIGQPAALEILGKIWLREEKAQLTVTLQGRRGAQSLFCGQKAEGLKPGIKSMLVFLKAQLLAALLQQGTYVVPAASPGLKGANFNIFSLHREQQPWEEWR